MLGLSSISCFIFLISLSSQIISVVLCLWTLSDLSFITCSDFVWSYFISEISFSMFDIVLSWLACILFWSVWIISILLCKAIFDFSIFSFVSFILLFVSSLLSSISWLISCMLSCMFSMSCLTSQKWLATVVCWSFLSVFISSLIFHTSDYKRSFILYFFSK